MKVLVAQSCLTLYDPHGLLACQVSLEILQARILECIAIYFTRGSFWPRDRTWVSCIAGGFFTIWATREAQTIDTCNYKDQSQSTFAEYKPDNQTVHLAAPGLSRSTQALLSPLQHAFDFNCSIQYLLVVASKLLAAARGI